MLSKLAGASVYLECRCRDWSFIHLRPLLALLLVVVGSVAARMTRGPVAVTCILMACRFSDGRRFQQAVRSHLHLVVEHSASLVASARRLETLDRRCLVLAEPRVSGTRILRKGVLLVSFTETSSALFSSVDASELAKRFHLVLEPSWAGYADPAILCWLNVTDPVLVQSPEENDRKLLETLQSNLVAVEYGAGDWIDPARFEPGSVRQRKYDAICVANFGWWKRVHVFLRAVAVASSQMREFKALLVLASYGRTRRNANDVEKLVRFFGIEQNVTLMVGVPHSELASLYAASKVCVFPSLKEGSSRVIYEAMCCNTPVLVLDSNIGVNKNYINAETGMLVSEPNLGRALVRFARQEVRTAPRAWFVAHLGPDNTTRKLEADLHNLFPGENWSQGGLHAKANAPEAQFIDQNWNPKLSEWMNTSKADGS
jgi:glycosyltransferase involved in cell wall biosynthesis